MNTTSVMERTRGIRTSAPIPIGMLKDERSNLAIAPSGLSLTTWNMGVMIREYWNRFQRNHRCPSAINFPMIGTQNARDLQTIPNRKPKVSPRGLISTSPRITEPAKPIVHAPKNIGIRSRLTLSSRKTCHVRRLKANAVPIPEIMNKAASLHWCIQWRIMLVKSTDSGV